MSNPARVARTHTAVWRTPGETDGKTGFVFLMTPTFGAVLVIIIIYNIIECHSVIDGSVHNPEHR